MPVQFSTSLLFRLASDCQWLPSFSQTRLAFRRQGFSSPAKSADWKAIFSFLGHAARRAPGASSFVPASASWQTGERYPASATSITSSAQTADPQKRCNNNHKRMAEYNIEGFENGACKSPRCMIDKSKIRDRSKLLIPLLSDPGMRICREWTRQPEYLNGEVQ